MQAAGAPSTLRLLYKPRSLDLDVAYAATLDWLGERGLPLRLKSLRALDRETHGWVEHVEHRDPAERDAARRYYVRCGSLLCLWYLLDGADCHYDNVIACGEQPVIVDLEALFHQSSLAASEGGGAEWQTARGLHDSVLRTGLLPRWRYNRELRQAYDMSGLGAVAPELMTS